MSEMHNQQYETLRETIAALESQKADVRVCLRKVLATILALEKLSEDENWLDELRGNWQLIELAYARAAASNLKTLPSDDNEAVWDAIDAMKKLVSEKIAPANDARR